jgi:PIN domain nuclease of toxin-antitoxin system
VNLSEVISRFARDGHNPWSVLHQITQSAVETVPFLAEDAALAAALIPAARPLGLSLGDRACLALAISRKISVYTADRIWAQLKVEVSIQIIR